MKIRCTKKHTSVYGYVLVPGKYYQCRTTLGYIKVYIEENQVINFTANFKFLKTIFDNEDLMQLVLTEPQ